MALPLQTYTYINNILIGKRYLDHRGPFHVTCLQDERLLPVQDLGAHAGQEPARGGPLHACLVHLHVNGPLKQSCTHRST